ncbi:hypothetical protein AK830_g3060 [Neonectria ditissima]|uniref:DUF1996 domain-containing protein n=1 Tax=Neonectria ditissima TaxID=78410 RepID=A0A0P7B9P5_9HYPO|nr:hypothetical protein AK830_g3060 [Neonectria ditissima]
MKFAVIAFIATLAGTAMAKEEGTFAVLRFTGKELTKGRMDPIIAPGEVFSHVHSVMGGSGFSSSATGKDMLDSKCSNALVKGDNSAYWFPSLYFHDPETGDFESVELYYFNAYYFFEATNDDIKAFPVGLNMVAGNAMTRVMPETGSKPNLDPSKGPVNPARITCPRLKNIFDPPSWPADSDGTEAGVGDAVNLGEGVGFPDRTCDGQYSPMRADVHFPSCYNPDAGLTNYKKNMVFPSDNDGKLDCPKGYTHVPQLFYEVYWDTQKFQGRWEEGKGEQPFVWSNGDVTGYSNHADFLAGWDEDLLQHIIDTCDAGTGGMDNCPGLFYGVNDEKCTIESEVDEKVDGTMDKLPGGCTLSGFQYGNGDSSDDSGSTTSASSKASGEDATASASSVASSSVVVSSAASSSAVVSSATASTTKYAAADKPTTSAPYQATGSAEVVSTSSEAVSYSEPPKATSVSSVSEAAKPTDIYSNPGKSTCKRKTHTVWNTVTVTETAPSAATQTNDNSYKRDHIRRHMHSHGRRHY